MAQMTESKYKALKSEYLKIKKEYEQAIAAQQAANSEGDLKENEEYHTARARTELIAKQKVELEQEIESAEIIPEDKSARISIGSVVDICLVDAKGKPLGEERRLTVDKVGDTIIKKTLGITSSLGKVILNSTGGVYKIPENVGMYYRVKKVRS